MIRDWLDREAKGSTVLVYCLGAALFAALFLLTAQWLFIILDVVDDFGFPMEMTLSDVKYNFLLNPLFQELVRSLVLYVAVYNSNSSSRPIVLAVLLSSAALSLLAGEEMIQKYYAFFLGILFSLVYLKCGGYDGKWRKPLLSALATNSFTFFIYTVVFAYVYYNTP